MDPDDFLDHLAGLFAAHEEDHDVPGFDSCRTDSRGQMKA